VPPPTSPQPWTAPLAPAPIRSTVSVPGSKSQTNRALVLAALASGPSVIRNGLDARDTRLMRDGLRAIGVQITETGDQWQVTPPARFFGDVAVDCGLAGTVMRFLPALALLADGPVRFDGDAQAYARPMGPLLEALRKLGASVDSRGDTLPFTVDGAPMRRERVEGSSTASGRINRPEVTVDASGSSQFVSALLMVAARLPGGLDLRHAGPPLPSRPHIEMTVAMLRERQVRIDESEPDRWLVAPGPIAPRDETIEPDLSNAAVFLAAAAITGGAVTVPHWPGSTTQAGDAIRDILTRFGAEAGFDERGLTVRGTDHLHGVDLDLSAASELTPVVAAVAALADGTSHLHGIAHIRGHETDRLAALAAELERLGGHVRETDNGLTIHPRLLGGAEWRTYADHRMAQAGALLGLVVPEVTVDDIGCTDKTMPEFADLWQAMISSSQVDASTQAGGTTPPDPPEKARVS
jgi:3-phosphoshikimate 1-carboxyvinyltransferase